MKLQHNTPHGHEKVMQFWVLCCYKHQQMLIWVFWNQGLGLGHALVFLIVCVSTVFIVSLLTII